jgi:hypothetical protein
MPSPPPFVKVADPDAADFQRGGKQPLSTTVRQQIEQLRQQRGQRAQIRERARALADQLENAGGAQLAHRLREATRDPATDVIEVATLVLDRDDQLWLHVEVKAGTAEVWVNQRRLGEFGADDMAGWQIVTAPELSMGDNVLMTAVTPEPTSGAFDARLLARRASDGEDLHAQTLHFRGTAEGANPAPTVALCRVWVEQFAGRLYLTTPRGAAFASPRSESSNGRQLVVCHDAWR